MLVTKKNKAFDEDLPAVIKKKPRCKKSRDKFSLLYIIPIQALSLREVGGKIKGGKRLGFQSMIPWHASNANLTSSSIKDLASLSTTSFHMVETLVFKMPSVPSMSFTSVLNMNFTSMPSMSSRSITVGAQRRNLGTMKKRTSAAAVRGRAAAMIELIRVGRWRRYRGSWWNADCW